MKDNLSPQQRQARYLERRKLISNAVMGGHYKQRDVAMATGLGKTTVSRISKELVKEGLLGMVKGRLCKPGDESTVTYDPSKKSPAEESPVSDEGLLARIEKLEKMVAILWGDDVDEEDDIEEEDSDPNSSVHDIRVIALDGKPWYVKKEKQDELVIDISEINVERIRTLLNGLGKDELSRLAVEIGIDQDEYATAIEKACVTCTPEAATAFGTDEAITTEDPTIVEEAKYNASFQLAVRYCGEYLNGDMTALSLRPEMDSWTKKGYIERMSEDSEVIAKAVEQIPGVSA